MVDVIKWDQESENDVVFTYPNQEFQWGSQLVVDESQKAIFYRDGKAYDVLPAGRHLLTTANLPLLTSALKGVRHAVHLWRVRVFRQHELLF